MSPTLLNLCVLLATLPSAAGRHDAASTATVDASGEAAVSVVSQTSTTAEQRAAEEHRAGFARLQFIQGTWRRVVPAADGSAVAADGLEGLEITPYLGGKYLRTQGTMGSTAFEILFSYSQPEHRYVLSILDDQSGVFDVYDGDFLAAGSLVVTNAQFFRVTLVQTAGDSFQWIGSYSRDQGATWKVNATYVLERADASTEGSSLVDAQREPTPPQPVSTPSARAAEAKFAAGFDRLRPLAGAWTAVAWEPGEDGRLVSGRTLTLTFSPGLGGKYLELQQALDGVECRIVLSYFQPDDSYRVAILDDQSGLIHVYSGGFGDDGNLVLTSPLHSRITIVQGTDGSWQWIDDSSPDRGATWKTNAVYRLSNAN